MQQFSTEHGSADAWRCIHCRCGRRFPHRRIGANTRAKRIIANLTVGKIEESEGFHFDYLGLGCEEFNLGWVARFTSPESGASVQALTIEAWGVRRFLVRAPDGSIVNVVRHRD